MKSRSKIATVIVTYNAETFIEKCLRSLQRSGVDTSVIVIDNHSSDHTAQIVRDQFPQAQLIESAVNLGFGRANNIGINLALSNQAEFIFLLNQDAWIEAETLSQLLAVAEAYPEYGILSPLQLKYDGSHWHGGFRRYVEMFAPSMLSQQEINPLDVYEVNFVPAALWFISSSALRKAGGFDPIYFMYGEDDDLAARIRTAGFKVGVAPIAKAHHMEKSFSEQGVPTKRLAAKYFNHYTAVLKYSEHGFLYRYLSTLKAAVQDAFACSTQRKNREAKAVALALWSILKIVPEVESSRKLMKSEGAFLDLS